jgi:valyl-tRNA synthetase
MPYITEAIWLELGDRDNAARSTIMLEAYPLPADFAADPNAELEVAWLKGVIQGVRNIRGEANIKPKRQIELLLQGGGASDRRLAETTGPLLTRLANLSSINWLATNEVPPAHALQLIGSLRVMVPLAGLIDVAEERARLTKEIGKREQDLQRIEAKLTNSKFVDNAPSEVVAKERVKAAAQAAAITTLRTQLKGLEDL